MEAILDKIRKLKDKGNKGPEETENAKEKIKRDPISLGKVHPSEKGYRFSNDDYYAFYISDVDDYVEKTQRSKEIYKGTEGIVVYCHSKDPFDSPSGLLFGKKYAQIIEDFAYSDDPIKKRCIQEAAQKTLDRWNAEEYEVMTPFYTLEKEYKKRKFLSALKQKGRDIFGK